LSVLEPLSGRSTLTDESGVYVLAAGQARVGRPLHPGPEIVRARREAFQGRSIEVIWLDEEPDQDIITDGLLQTMDTPTMPGGGLLMLTFTPLKGMTPLILSFLQDSKTHDQ
jgi:phage terminase large subunit-like protein